MLQWFCHLHVVCCFKVFFFLFLNQSQASSWLILGRFGSYVKVLRWCWMRFITNSKFNCLILQKWKQFCDVIYVRSPSKSLEKFLQNLKLFFFSCPSINNPRNSFSRYFLRNDQYCVRANDPNAQKKLLQHCSPSVDPFCRFCEVSRKHRSKVEIHRIKAHHLLFIRKHFEVTKKNLFDFNVQRYRFLEWFIALADSHECTMKREIILLQNRKI